MCEDRLYFSDWNKKNIQSCDKYTCADHEVLYDGTWTTMPQGLNVYHEVFQPPVDNPPCKNSTCSHLCLIKLGGRSHQCMCSDGHTSTVRHFFYCGRIFKFLFSNIFFNRRMEGKPVFQFLQPQLQLQDHQQPEGTFHGT